MSLKTTCGACRPKERKTPGRIWCHAEDTSALNTAIAQLPDKYRVPLVLAYFNDSSYDQIAEALSISRNHVGVLLLRAKQRLRSGMEDSIAREPGS